MPNNDSLIHVLNTSKFEHDTVKINILLKLGNRYIELDDQALLYSQKALALSQKINWVKGKYNSHRLVGYNYVVKNKLMKAISEFYLALEFAQTLKEKGAIYRTMGDCYAELGDEKNSEFYFSQSMDIFKNNNDTYNYLLSLNNFSIAYNELNKFKEAERLILQGLTLNKNKYEDIQNYLNANLAYTLYQMGRYEESLNLHKKLINKSKGEYINILYLSYISRIYFNQKKYPEAEKFLNEALNLSKNFNLKADAYLDIDPIAAKIYEHKKDYKRANFHLNRYWNSEILKTNQNAKERIEALEFGFKNKQNQLEIKDLKQFRILLVSSLLGLLIFISVLYLLYVKLKRNLALVESQKVKLNELADSLSKLNSSLELQVSQRTEELQFANMDLIKKNFEITEALYKGQTIERKRVAAELHDNLGSTLSALKWRLGALDADSLSPKEKLIYESIRSMMGSAYEEVRHISHNLLPVEFEKYGLGMAIQKIINEINENGEMQINCKIKSDLSKIPHLVALELYSIILELISNLLKHSEATLAELSLSFINQKVELEIKDNGIGLKKISDNNGRGLQNIQNRLSSFNGNITINTSKTWSTIIEVSTNLVD